MEYLSLLPTARVPAPSERDKLARAMTAEALAFTWQVVAKELSSRVTLAAQVRRHSIGAAISTEVGAR